MIQGSGRVEQVDASIGAHTPVCVLTTAVDTLEGFFVKENLKSVTVSNGVEGFHGQQVVVNSDGRVFKDGSNFKLVWSNLYEKKQTSLWRVLRGTPSLNSSSSTSPIVAVTREGIAPK